MSASFESRIEYSKRKEAYISCELYRLFKNAISAGLTYQETRCEFKDAVPEFSVNSDRADLVIFASRYGSGRVEPFLVIEVRVRALYRPGRSIANAVSRARYYAKKLSTNPAFPFVAYDGWTLLAFRNISPYLIKVCGSIADQYKARDLLVGLEEYSYRGKSDLLDRLPKHPDLEFLTRRVMPSVAKVFAESPQEAERLVGAWRALLS
jgi:hypothetical protein